jgi:hypothetical protein
MRRPDKWSFVPHRRLQRKQSATCRKPLLRGLATTLTHDIHSHHCNINRQNADTLQQSKPLQADRLHSLLP